MAEKSFESPRAKDRQTLAQYCDQKQRQSDLYEESIDKWVHGYLTLSAPLSAAAFKKFDEQFRRDNDPCMLEIWEVIKEDGTAEQILEAREMYRGHLLRGDERFRKFKRSLHRIDIMDRAEFVA